MQSRSHQPDPPHAVCGNRPARAACQFGAIGASAVRQGGLTGALSRLLAGSGAPVFSKTALPPSIAVAREPQANSYGIIHVTRFVISLRAQIAWLILS
jgi:hypothetical protein